MKKQAHDGCAFRSSDFCRPQNRKAWRDNKKKDVGEWERRKGLVWAGHAFVSVRLLIIGPIYQCTGPN